MTGNSRVWVYQANRPITTQESVQISKILTQFVGKWNAHGQDLDGGFEIRDNHFIILWVNEETHGPSGCSIDSSVQCIRKIEQEFNLNLTDKSMVAFDIDGRIELIHFSKIKEAIEEGKIAKNTPMFDNSVANYQDFNSKWKVAASQSWTKRFF